VLSQGPLGVLAQSLVPNFQQLQSLDTLGMMMLCWGVTSGWLAVSSGLLGGSLLQTKQTEQGLFDRV
jgi:hypothetical protein